MKGTRRLNRAARRLFRLCLVDGRLDEIRARQVMQRIAAARPRSAPALLAQFGRFVRLERDRHLARVESAVLLADDVRDEVRTRLASAYGSGLDIAFAQDAALIAGMRITVGSDVYDGSVRARLAVLEARL